MYACRVLLAILLLAGGGGHVLQAVPIFIASTGIDLLPPGGIDDYYTLTFTPFGPTGTPAYVAQNEATITPNTGGAWVTGPGSRWIAPANLSDGDSFPGGKYEYTMTFNLYGFVASSLVITGMWAADGFGSDILINGKSTGITTNDPIFGQSTNYTAMKAFVITNSSCAGGCFLPSLNTLVLQVMNGAFETGVRAELSGDALAPEPGTFFGVTGALLVLGLLRRKRLAR